MNAPVTRPHRAESTLCRYLRSRRSSVIKSHQTGPLRLTKPDSDEPIRSQFDNPPLPAETDKAAQQIRKAVRYSLINRPFSTLAKGLSPSEWNLDGFRSRFYRQYEAKQDAVEDTLRAAIRPDRSELTDALTSQMAKYATAVDNGAKPSDILAGLGNAYFGQSLNDDVIGLQMLAWVAASEHTVLKDDFVALYDSLNQRTVEGLSTMLEGWGRTPIEPFTWTDIATTLTAITEGLLIRHAVDPTKVHLELHGQIATAIIASMTKHTCENITHVRDRLDQPHNC